MTVREPLTQDRSLPQALSSDGLVADANFVVATRDSGYRNIVAAISELIDNALQAKASNVHIFVIEEKVERERALTIGILDDGTGMNPVELRQALRFGGTNRFGDRSGLGRYGMGLPNSSVSQAKRFEVYSWSLANKCFRTYLDVDEIACGRLHSVPPPTSAFLPSWALGSAGASGTLIAWTRCDRLNHRKAVTVASKLHGPLGRIYRRFIWSGKRLFVNGEVILASDPIFSHPTTGTGGGEEYGIPLIYNIRVPGAESTTSPVTVRFVELPIAQWHTLSLEEKRSRGIVGGGGVSVLRAGREIDCGWHFMGSKRRENYDDWWRCECAFEPPLDELFGVTHNKQGIAPRRELKKILALDLEAVAHELNARARAAFGRVRSQSDSRAVVRASYSEPFLPPLVPTISDERTRGRYRYRIEIAPQHTPEFFTVSLHDGEIRVVFNSDHPFVNGVYLSSRHEKTNPVQSAIESMVLSAARAKLQASSYLEPRFLERLYCDWGDALAAFVGR
ncbi:MAG: ATP-binding protein [Acidobacteriota bacterium]|nr:ATP-binding protein [Acidobacteriota bacterium]